MLAAGAHALLRCHGTVVGARLDPGEDVLELNHPRVCEHERRIVAGHEGARSHHLVSIPGEEVQEGRANFFRRRHANHKSKSVSESRFGPAGCPALGEGAR